MSQSAEDLRLALKPLSMEDLNLPQKEKVFLFSPHDARPFRDLRKSPFSHTQERLRTKNINTRFPLPWAQSDDSYFTWLLT